ncbi:hypothetical protein O181_101360 [Austropuccinia psidii MF-1]|uniref:Uncharacterized protein n=1 Tax=Austropuccinia psidii MF-1 TaxID=1389203 RepID=A0A9Q3JEA8_9BASI|nr:hypothetical protein [Austropuccinia psidii MF-1]
MPPPPPSPPLMPPCTCLILSAAYHPYAHGVPSKHASDTAYHPYACGCPPDMPPMPLTILMLAVPSRHASNAPLTLAQSARRLVILTLLQPPQDDTTMPPPISALTTPPPSTPLTPPCTRLMLSTAYHPYACGCPPNMPPMLLTILMLAVPSRNSSNARLTLAQSSRPLMILKLLQPPQDETTMPPPILPSPPPPFLLRCFQLLLSRCALKICL